MMDNSSQRIAQDDRTESPGSKGSTRCISKEPLMEIMLHTVGIALTCMHHFYASQFIVTTHSGGDGDCAISTKGLQLASITNNHHRSARRKAHFLFYTLYCCKKLARFLFWVEQTKLISASRLLLILKWELQTEVASGIVVKKWQRFTAFYLEI